MLPCLSPCTGPGSILKSLLVEYRLCLGATLFFAVSFAGKVVVYRVVYVLLFLFWGPFCSGLSNTIIGHLLCARPELEF